MATQDHDPSLEFPGFKSESNFTDMKHVDEVTERDPFHLVVLQSPVVPSKRNIANISEHAEVSIGRDIPSDLDAIRLRLKEMAVSKFHAIFFWDSERRAWGLVDVGSVHGTFVQSYGSSTLQRLSSAKTASHPRFLRHLDVIQIGGSTMSCHLHTQESPECEDCILTPSNGLSLLHQPKPAESSASVKPSRTSLHSFAMPQDAKASLSELKSQLLRLDYKRDVAKDAAPTIYVDRAASRRMHFGTSTPPVERPPPEVVDLRPSRTRVTYERAVQPAASLMKRPSQADAPPRQPEIPSSNIGHQLLSKQGWKPGRGLGVDSAGVTQPLIIKTVSNRAGLGSRVDDEMQ